eukprot:CAMPEP_0204840910 /NCGR_PEP_ID=MMETSP1346-20131115/39503_1 /ASSEMBLY_ACC=CAM_ASM_000771 /TAXON_ID=215587 /ORGANISM="Aplanochytrium stocchinoi, Strain GSBS06" /LENGTH=436 /DNA_ID=CAMNT_0051978609 /DNA_START=54 /DNA_END=1364 /DNA_ORIENTATION=+
MICSASASARSHGLKKVLALGKRSAKVLKRSLSSNGSANTNSVARPGMSVYSWGTGTEGQLGHGEVDISGLLSTTYTEMSPKRIDALESLNGGIVDIACGTSHAAAVTADGQVLTWGNADNGKLGHNKATGKVCLLPQPVEGELSERKVVQVECGKHYTAALTEEGDLYTWGRGETMTGGPGPLGHGDGKARKIPEKVFIGGKEDLKLKSIALGEKHMISLGLDGEVWSWGKGEFGRLGNFANTDQATPFPIEYFLDMDIVVKQIACGQKFCIALTEKGDVYSWGANDKCQLGLGGGLAMDYASMETLPTHVENIPERISHISAGFGHGVAVSESGGLYFWGSSLWFEPHLMTALKDHRIVQATCGNSFTVALSDAGQLFSWGKGFGFTLGKTGALGQGHANKVVQPELIQSVANYPMQKVEAGDKFCLALSGLPN